MFGLGLGLVGSALAAAVVGSLVAAGVSRLTDIKVELPVEEIDIDLPGTLVDYEDWEEENVEEEDLEDEDREEEDGDKEDREEDDGEEEDKHWKINTKSKRNHFKKYSWSKFGGKNGRKGTGSKLGKFVD